jgi:hypothetical protein
MLAVPAEAVRALALLQTGELLDVAHADVCLQITLTI